MAASCGHPYLRLARIVHEGLVNNPGLPDQDPFPPAAGGYLAIRAHRAAPPYTGDARAVPARRLQEFSV